MRPEIFFQRFKNTDTDERGQNRQMRYAVIRSSPPNRSTARPVRVPKPTVTCAGGGDGPQTNPSRRRPLIYLAHDFVIARGYIMQHALVGRHNSGFSIQST